MSRFLLREIPYSNIHVELAEIGFDSLYLDVISEKFRYKNIKIINSSGKYIETNGFNLRSRLCRQ